jgi:hypothetical protein
MTQFLSLKHTPNQAIYSGVQQVYGTDVLTLRTIEKWTAAFEGGRTDLADLPIPGRPFWIDFSRTTIGAIWMPPA